MFKFIAILALISSTVQAGLIQTHHVIEQEPVLAKVGHVLHSAPSAVSHQSLTQVHHSKSIVQPILAPAIKTTVHAAPILKTVHAPVVHTYHAAPIVHSLPLLQSSPLLHSTSVIHTAPLLHSAPLVAVHH